MSEDAKNLMASLRRFHEQNKKFHYLMIGIPVGAALLYYLISVDTSYRITNVAEMAISRSNTKEALTWLNDHHSSSSNRLNGMNTGDSKSLVESFYSHGALRVYACAFREAGDGCYVSKILIIERPADKNIRMALYDQYKLLQQKRSKEALEDTMSAYIIIRFE
jgi:hypothetical protein